MAEKDGPLLDLDTLIARPTIRIDGTDYEMKRGAEMSLVEYQRVVRFGAKLAKLHGVSLQGGQGLVTAEGEIPEDDLIESSAAMDGLCRLVLMAPAEVHERLTDTHRAKIIQVFITLNPKAATEARERAAAAPGGRTSTGASKSRGSRGSTVSRP